MSQIGGTGSLSLGLGNLGGSVNTLGTTGVIQTGLGATGVIGSFGYTTLVPAGRGNGTYYNPGPYTQYFPAVLPPPQGYIPPDPPPAPPWGGYWPPGVPGDPRSNPDFLFKKFSIFGDG